MGAKAKTSASRENAEPRSTQRHVMPSPNMAYGSVGWILSKNQAPR